MEMEARFSRRYQMNGNPLARENAVAQRKQRDDTDWGKVGQGVAVNVEKSISTEERRVA